MSCFAAHLLIRSGAIRIKYWINIQIKLYLVKNIMKCEKYESDPPLWKAIRWEIKFISKNVGFLFISLFHLITYHQNKCIKFSGRFFIFFCLSLHWNGTTKIEKWRKIRRKWEKFYCSYFFTQIFPSSVAKRIKNRMNKNQQQKLH